MCTLTLYPQVHTSTPQPRRPPGDLHGCYPPSAPQSAFSGAQRGGSCRLSRRYCSSSGGCCRWSFTVLCLSWPTLRYVHAPSSPFTELHCHLSVHQPFCPVADFRLLDPLHVLWFRRYHRCSSRFARCTSIIQPRIWSWPSRHLVVPNAGTRGLHHRTASSKATGRIEVAAVLEAFGLSLKAQFSPAHTDNSGRRRRRRFPITS